MREFINEIKEWLEEVFFLAKVKLRLKMAIRMAEYKHYISNKKYYVLPSIDGGLMVIDRSRIKLKKKQGLIPNSYQALELQEKAFYYTPNVRGGTGASYEERVAMKKRHDNYIRNLRRLKVKIGNPVPKRVKKTR